MADLFESWVKQRINGLAKYARHAASRDAFDRANEAWEKRKVLIEVEAAYRRIRSGEPPKISGLGATAVFVDEMLGHNPVPSYKVNAGAHRPGPAPDIHDAIKTGDDSGVF